MSQISNGRDAAVFRYLASPSRGFGCLKNQVEFLCITRIVHRVMMKEDLLICKEGAIVLPRYDFCVFEAKDYYFVEEDRLFRAKISAVKTERIWGLRLKASLDRAKRLTEEYSKALLQIFPLNVHNKRFLAVRFHCILQMLLFLLATVVSPTAICATGHRARHFSIANCHNTAIQFVDILIVIYNEYRCVWAIVWVYDAFKIMHSQCHVIEQKPLRQRKTNAFSIPKHQMRQLKKLLLPITTINELKSQSSLTHVQTEMLDSAHHGLITSSNQAQRHINALFHSRTPNETMVP
ncbi:Uncharacterized protein Fot_34893 [Forsythia ovata]|uniref:Uncharacterized protein n=1 Tax=Forsythia ovata TaxID=205694 RepID=A0ABD1SKA8_9LAMI